MEEISGTANVCQQISKRKLIVNGSPALDVVYKTADGSFMEEVYVFSGVKTMDLTFSGEPDKPNVLIDKLANYSTYRMMVGVSGWVPATQAQPSPWLLIAATA